MTTPQNPFAQPDKGDRFTPRDHPEWLGRLFIIYPDSVNQHQGTDDKGQPTTYEAVEADVAIVDLVNPETGQPTVLSGARIANKALVPQIKKHCGGGMVLGRLAQAAPQGRNSGAYYLAEYSDADAQTAMQYVAANPRNQFTQPTGQQAPPAQQYAQQAPAQAPYGAPQAQPQYASQQLPYDPWQGTQAAPQGAPAGPPPGQWQAPAQAPQGPPAGQWGQPAGTAPGAPAPTPPASPSAQQWGAAPQPNGQQPLPQAAPSNPAATAPAAAAPPLDPQLVAFLLSKGVPNVESMSDGQARMIAATFPQQ